MERGKPIAKLVPLAKDSGGTLSHMHELAACRIGPCFRKRQAAGWILEASPTEGSEAARALQALLAERAEAR